MKTSRTWAVTDVRTLQRFDALRRRLADEQFADRWDKPLAYWVLPADRRLPLAFLNWTVRALVDAPLEELQATPGVGRQKMGALLKLLQRAVNEGDWPVHPPEEPSAAPLPSAIEGAEAFDPQQFSEATWAHWRQWVVEHGLDEEPLGRFTPALEHLPRVLWETPLGSYTHLSLAEIRALPTHGEKRVQGVLEVFAALAAVLGRVPSGGPLSVRLEPPRMYAIERWLERVAMREELPTPEEIATELWRPLLAQVRLDAGAMVADLAAHRLGLDGAEATVREEADRLGLTRARVYQLLSDVAVVTRLRWPAGGALVHSLAARLPSSAGALEEYEQFWTALEMFFPLRHAGRGTRLLSGEAAIKCAG